MLGVSGSIISSVVYPVTATTSASGVIGSAVLLARRFRRRSELRDRFMRDWFGEEGRPGRDRRPGVMERLQALEQMPTQIADIHHEIKPNGGQSMKDQLNRLDPAYPSSVGSE